MAIKINNIVSAAAAMFAFGKLVRASGSAMINNKCGFDVYLWHVSSDHVDSSPTIIKANGGDYSESYVSCSTGGVSLKLSDSATQQTYITQYEYTLEPSMVFYDLSNVNCKDDSCPFWKGGMTLTPSISSCANVECAAGDLLCHAAYNLFNDDWASHGCATSTDLTLTLCPGGSGSSGSGGSGAEPSSSSSPSPVAYTPPASPKPKHSSPPKVSKPDVAVANVDLTTSSTTIPTTPLVLPTSTTPPPAPSTTLITSTRVAPKPKPKPTPKSTSTSSPPATTPAPVVDVPAYTQWFTDVAIETAYRTVVVTVDARGAHEDYHKNKKREAVHHRHVRHHLHQ